MKKLLFLSIFLALLTGCIKDDSVDSEVNYDFDPSLSSLQEKSEEFVIKTDGEVQHDYDVEVDANFKEEAEEEPTKEELEEQRRNRYLNQFCLKNPLDEEAVSSYVIRDFGKNCWYSKSTRKLIESPGSGGMEPIPENCAPDLETELEKREYNFVQGCLYKNLEPVFDKTIFSMILSGEFGQDYRFPKTPYEGNEDKKSIGVDLGEWLRFKHDNKLHIFFIGIGECGGCTFTGPFLIVDETTGTIEKKSADIPYYYFLLPSPDYKKAIEVECGNREIYLYDFIKLERIKMLFKIPEGTGVMECSEYEFIHSDLFNWLDNNRVQIQPAKADDEGSVIMSGREEYGRYISDQYTPIGDPVVIDITE